MIDLQNLRRAGAMVGPTSDAAWQKLVATHGADAVEVAVERLHEKNHQPVSVAVVASTLEREARERDEDAEDVPPSCTAPADRDLPARVLARIADQKISRTAAAEAIGIPLHTLNNYLLLTIAPSRSVEIVAKCKVWLATPIVAPAAPASPPAPVANPTPPPPVSTASEPTPAAAEARSPATAAGPDVTDQPTAQAIQPARSAKQKKQGPAMATAPLHKTHRAALKARMSSLDIKGNAHAAAAIGISAPTLRLALGGDPISAKASAKIKSWASGEFTPNPADSAQRKSDDLNNKLTEVEIEVRQAKLKNLQRIDARPRLQTADSFIDQMDALGVAISALARVDAGATAVLARMYASVADHVAEEEAKA